MTGMPLATRAIDPVRFGRNASMSTSHPSVSARADTSSDQREAHETRTVRRAPEPPSNADRAMRPLPEAGETDPLPDAGAPELAREHPANGIASHGSATSRKI